ncbi:Coronin-like protein crn1, partial [Ceratobasidium sp. 392]
MDAYSSGKLNPRSLTQSRDFDPIADLSGSGRKVGPVLFQPAAEKVLAAPAVGDGTVRLWDLSNAGDAKISLTGHTDTIRPLTWNPAGTLLATTCRDRKIRLFDPRAGSEAVRVGDAHGGINRARVVRMGAHDLSSGVWDVGSLGNIKTVSINQSSGVIMPFWSDNNLLFLAGKGDSNIRYYEYESDRLHELSEHKSIDPQRGMCFLPRRALEATECEITRACKVYGSTIEPIAFVVPRKSDQFQSDQFQSDIFPPPPPPSSEPALTAGEFFLGKTSPLNLADLSTGAVSADPSPAPTPVAAPPAPALASAPAP